MSRLEDLARYVSLDESHKPRSDLAGQAHFIRVKKKGTRCNVCFKAGSQRNWR